MTQPGTIGTQAPETIAASNTVAMSRRLAGAAIIMMLSFLASRLLGLVRNIVVAHQFGTGAEYYAYLTANRIPEFVFQVLAGGAVASAFIPVFSSYLAHKEEHKAWQLTSSLWNLSVMLITPVVVLCFIFAPQLIDILMSGPETTAYERMLATDMTRIMIVAPIIFAISCFATSVLNSFHRFTLTALAPVIYNISIIFGAMMSNVQINGKEIGIYGMAYGVVIGALGHLLIQVPGLIQQRMRYNPLPVPAAIRDPGVREVGRLMGPRMIGLGAVQLTFLFNIFLSSYLPSGSYPALDIAWLLTMMPLSMFGMAISTAVFPTLTADAALNEISKMRRVLSASLRTILYLTIPASVGLILLRVPVVQLLYQRGEFDAQSTALVSQALEVYAISLFAQAATEIIVRAFYALHDTRTPVAASVASVVLNLVLAYVLVSTTNLSHVSIALATTISLVLEAVVLLLIIQKRIGGLDLGVLGQAILKMVIGTLLMSAIILLLGKVFTLPFVEGTTVDLQSYQVLRQVLVIGFTIVAGAGVYVLSTLAMRSEELLRIWGIIRRRR